MSIEAQGHSLTLLFSGFVCFVLLLGPDIRCAFTGPLVFWFTICIYSLNINVLIQRLSHAFLKPFVDFYLSFLNCFLFIKIIMIEVT